MLFPAAEELVEGFPVVVAHGQRLGNTAPYMHSSTHAQPASRAHFLRPWPRGRTLNPHVSANQRNPLFPGRVADPQAILAFLNALTAASHDRTVPAAVPSGLPVGGNIQ